MSGTRAPIRLAAPLYRVFFLACACAVPAAAAPAQGFVLAQFDGTSAGDLVGFGVAGPGDVDGDGIPDVLFGLPQCYWFTPCTPTCPPGAARVIAGGSAALLQNPVGAFGGEMFGWSVAGAGDVDGDGKADLVVGSLCGAPGAVSQAGTATVLSGASGGVLHAFGGANSGDWFGASVAGVGDVSGDGAPDVAAGSQEANYVRVFSGSSGALIHQFTGSGYFGTVAGLGDVNGDGRADVAVGASLAGPGQAFVFSGLTGGVLHTFTGTNPGDRFGGGLAGAGDVDGDGAPDLLVGAGTASPGGFIWAGQAKLFSGASGTLLHTFNGTAPGDGLGWSLAGLPDVSGDGVRDLLVGAHQGGNAGVGVPPGSGYARVYSGASGAPLLTVGGATTGDAFGRFVAGVGDVNLDGVGDFAVGAHSADPAGLQDAGSVRVYSVVGYPPGTSPFGAGCPGPTGVVPRLQTAGGAPSVATGNPGFRLVLSNARPSAFALLMIGFSNASWLGFPLPLDLAILGMPGCALRVSIDVPLLLATTADGLLSYPIPIPANPSLAGGTFFAQFYVVDPGPLPFPGTVTAGLSIQL